MNQNTSIIVSMDDAERAARAMAASGFFPDARQAAQAVVKILAGQELGFGPFASMTGVSIIQGKPVLGANLLAAAVKRTGKYNYRVHEMTDQACELIFIEAGQEVGRSRFTIQDAQTAGLTGKDSWKKYPRNMLFARALSNGQRWYAPDIFNGAVVYTPEELGAEVDGETGEIIEAVASEPQPEPVAELQPEQKPFPVVFDDTLPMMELETALAVTNKNGETYGSLDTEKLAYMHNSLRKHYRENNLTPAEKETLQMKMSAIQIILDDRRANKAFSDLAAKLGGA